MKEPPIN